MAAETTATPPFLRLSNELIAEILEHIAPDQDRHLTVDRREYLSKESFKTPAPPTRDQTAHIGLFRGICRRFADLGAARQFARLSTRFSVEGLLRLERIAASPGLARHVRKFSYLVPYFYSEESQGRLRDVLLSLQEKAHGLDVRAVTRKLKHQTYLIESREDERVLKRAFAAFTSLHHVQILALQDEQDALLLNFIRQHRNLTRLVDLKWEPACSHSTRTIATALLASTAPLCKFSSPMLSSQSAIALAREAPPNLARLAHPLTSLELHFVDGPDIDFDQRMQELSPLFHTVFSAATRMQAIHIGFPSHRPLSLPLESIFHNIQWAHLSCFGIQGWKLHATEIIAITARHRNHLRGLRLRHVLLKDGSRWKDVLPFLHNSVPRLDWTSLRSIGYASHFDEQWAAAGVEVPDELDPGGSSSSTSSTEDSDSDRSESTDDEISTTLYNGYHHNRADRAGHDNSELDSDDESSDSDAASSTTSAHHGPRAYEMAFPNIAPTGHGMVSPSTARDRLCTCSTQGAGADTAVSLDDDGQVVTYAQWKAWEKWVIRRCIVHGTQHNDKAL